MSETQQLAEMKKSSPKLTVMIRETNLSYEKFLIPVRIPIDKNLIGYRVLLIEKDEQPRLAKVKTLGELRKFTMGQVENWGDIEILEHSGFKVKTEARYDDLFKSLDAGKFKVFPRSLKLWMSIENLKVATPTWPLNPVCYSTIRYRHTSGFKTLRMVS